MVTDWQARIVSNPEVRGGQPTIRGMRITVKDVLGYLASGMTMGQVLDEFPYLEEPDVYAALAYAAENVPDSPAA